MNIIYEHSAPQFEQGAGHGDFGTLREYLRCLILLFQVAHLQADAAAVVLEEQGS